MHRPRRRTNQSSLSLRSFVISAGPFSFQSSVVTQWTQHRQCVPFTSTAHWHCLSIVLSSMPMRCICRTVLPFLAHRFPQICPHSHPRPFLFLCVSERLWSWRLVAVVVAARPVHSTHFARHHFVCCFGDAFFAPSKYCTPSLRVYNLKFGF